MTTKRCPRCQQDKALSDFNRDPSKPSGVVSRCRACTKELRVERKHRRSPRQGWCPNCTDGRHGRACTAAFFGPDCDCRCAVLGFRGPFPFGDPTAPAPMEFVV